MDWNKLKTFYQVAKVQNISKAANILKINQSSVSRQVKELERGFATPLLKRLKYGVCLTEQGEIVYQSLEKVINELKFMKDEIDTCSKKNQNDLTIVTTHSLANSWLVHYVPDFMKKHPHIRIQLSETNSYREVSSSKFEIVISPNLPQKASIIRKIFMVKELALFAHPSYLRKFGLPESVEDLKSHRLIGFEEGELSLPYKEINWIFNLVNNTIKPYMNVNSFYSLYKVAQEGLGIVSVPRQSPFLKGSDFVRLLPHLNSPKVKIYFSYLRLYESDPRILSFEKYIQSAIEKDYKIII